VAGGRSPSVGTGIGRLIAVLDTTEAAAAAIEALAAAGIDRASIELFSGPEAAAAFDPSGQRHGLLGVVYRIFEFSWADQAPDFAWYDAAIREGRVVMSVRIRGQRHVPRRDHRSTRPFINHFGWFETQELARWKGREPDVPGFLRR
jgi:hypothetical protein